MAQEKYYGVYSLHDGGWHRVGTKRLCTRGMFKGEMKYVDAKYTHDDAWEVASKVAMWEPKSVVRLKEVRNGVVASPEDVIMH